MTELELVISKMKLAIKECEIHVARANYALSECAFSFPIDKKNYENLNEKDIQALDQFIYRYTKLQDKIGSSLIKNTAYILDYSYENKTFIDILNLLEKHGIIKSANEWNILRALRNSLSHEYETDSMRQIEIINEARESYNILLNTFENIKSLVEKI